MRFGAGEPLRAPAAHDERTLRQLCELREEVLHEERLPDSRLAHHRQDPAAALARFLVGPAELRTLVLSPYGAALGDRGAALKRRLPRVSRSERRQFQLDFAHRGTQRRILREHPVHELLDPGGTDGFSRDSGTASSNRIAASTAGIVGATHGRRRASRRRDARAALLGGHVGHRADQCDRIGVRARCVCGGGPGLVNASQPEVQDFRVAVAAHHHVLGLDVAMDDAGGVGGGKRLRLPADVITVASVVSPSIFARSVAPSMNSWTM